MVSDPLLTMKTKKLNGVTYTLPAYWASYLINGDDSGMSEQDKRDCAAFLARKGLNRHHFVDSGEQWSQSHNDATAMYGDVCEFVYMPPNPIHQITDTQRLEFALQNGLFVQSVTTANFSYNPMSPMNPTRADIDRAIRTCRR